MFYCLSTMGTPSEFVPLGNNAAKFPGLPFPTKAGIPRQDNRSEQDFSSCDHSHPQRTVPLNAADLGSVSRLMKC